MPDRSISKGESEARYLRRLKQLREGKRPDSVSLEKTRADGTVDVWFAPGGSFGELPDGRWTYVDELGRSWGEPRRREAADTHGRLPYGHVVMRPEEAGRDRAGRAQIAFMRPALRQPAVDDRSGRGITPDGSSDGTGRQRSRRRRER